MPTEPEPQPPGHTIIFETAPTPARVETSEPIRPAIPRTEKASLVPSPRNKRFEEVPSSETKPHDRRIQPEVQASGKPATSKPKPEEKPSNDRQRPVEKSSSKLKFYNGSGRRHTDEQIDEILDWYLITQAETGVGQLPKYVSDRQRYHYRHHARLEDRRKLLEQAGQLPKTTASESNVFDLAERKVQRKRRTARRV